MIKIAVIAIFIFSFFHSYGQLSREVDFHLSKTIAKTQYENQFRRILERRYKIGTYQRIDSLKFSELTILEKYDDLSDSVYIVEIFISYPKDCDTLVFVNGVKTEFYFPISEIYEFPNFKEILEINKIRYKFFNKVKTGGCVRLPKRLIKKFMKQNLMHSFTIKSRITSKGTENLIINYPVKKPVFIIHRRVHQGGF